MPVNGMQQRSAPVPNEAVIFNWVNPSVVFTVLRRYPVRIIDDDDRFHSCWGDWYWIWLCGRSIFKVHTREYAAFLLGHRCLFREPTVASVRLNAGPRQHDARHVMQHRNISCNMPDMVKRMSNNTTMTY